MIRFLAGLPVTFAGAETRIKMEACKSVSELGFLQLCSTGGLDLTDRFLLGGRGLSFAL